MRAWPLEAGLQEQASNHLKPLRRSHGLGSWQVWIMETSTSEPLMRCRNKEDGVKTGVLSWFQDKHGGNLLTARAAPGIEVA
jgi:hypothetical protein